MRLRLMDLQESNRETQRIRAENLNGYKKPDGVLYYQELPFVLEAIWIKIISWYHNDPLAKHFSINKTKNLIGRKYY